MLIMDLFFSSSSSYMILQNLNYAAYHLNENRWLKKTQKYVRQPWRCWQRSVIHKVSD